jgi:hypothetical protein
MRVLWILMLVACSKPADDKKAPPVVAAKPKDIKACDLTSAAEVGKIFGKPIVATGGDASFCSFNLDPAERQKSIDAVTSGKAKSLDQVQVMIAVAHDDETEDQIKSANDRFTNAAVAATLPAGTKAQINHAITEVPGVADWAFTTDHSVTISGIAVGGRVFDARVGAWRVTITSTVSPDPGTKQLDAELMALARPVVAKLKN